MLSLKYGLLFLCLIIVICESSILDSLKKCSIRDEECHKDLYQSVLSNIGKHGIKELGIPPIDPIGLKNVSVSLLGLLDVTMEDGIATGISDCVFNSIKTDISRGHTSMDINCDAVAVKGHYKAYSNSPLMKLFLGQNNINGDGFGKIKIEKLNLKIDYDYDVIRGQDGEIYFKCNYNSTDYKYAVLGKAAFYVDNLLAGGEDISRFVTDFLNQNAQYAIESFGGPFMEKALEIFFLFNLRFFNAVPAKYFISEDLTSYLKN